MKNTFKSSLLLILVLLSSNAQAKTWSRLVLQAYNGLKPSKLKFGASSELSKADNAMIGDQIAHKAAINVDYILKNADKFAIGLVAGAALIGGAAWFYKRYWASNQVAEPVKAVETSDVYTPLNHKLVTFYTPTNSKKDDSLKQYLEFNGNTALKRSILSPILSNRANQAVSSQDNLLQRAPEEVVESLDRDHVLNTARVELEASRENGSGSGLDDDQWSIADSENSANGEINSELNDAFMVPDFAGDYDQAAQDHNTARTGIDPDSSNILDVSSGSSDFVYDDFTTAGDNLSIYSGYDFANSTEDVIDPNKLVFTTLPSHQRCIYDRQNICGDNGKVCFLTPGKYPMLMQKPSTKKTANGCAINDLISFDGSNYHYLCDGQKIRVYRFEDKLIVMCVTAKKLVIKQFFVGRYSAVRQLGKDLIFNLNNRPKYYYIESDKIVFVNDESQERQEIIFNFQVPKDVRL